MKNQYDIFWIGTGQATGTIVPRLAKEGKKVALAEGGRFGGSCVNYGCTPTKTIVASARAAHMARRGADFGVQTGEIKVDFSKVMQRQNHIRHSTSEGFEGWMRGMENVDIYPHFAAFEDPHTVRVGDESIRAETIVINAGGRSRVVPIDGLDQVDWLDNARLLDLKELPDHLVIVGGSYISLEFAQAFRRLGSQVTVLEASSQIMFREDEDIALAAQEILESEGISIYLNARAKRLSQNRPGDIEVRFDRDGQDVQVRGSHLLMAVGRVPNSDRLNLDAAGVEVDERGFIRVNDVMQTNQPHIFAVGDINGEGAFTHTSVNDGEIFWDFYSGADDRTLSQRIPTYAMFIDPPLGRVGMSEKEARLSERNVLMATRLMKSISRAKEKDETAGLIKILVDADTEQFLGATILGVGGDEIVNMFTPFMYAKQSYKLFRKAVLAHPTVAELMPWILDDLKPLI
ncbi:MAG: mercuric reductase [Anaerolineales bacterium]|nr:mercuric reductase [Chloroflexota bacterium]MBL6980027.1 mercuric reductase [Anaerolineales bacterium]